MQIKNFTLTAEDGALLSCNYWLPDKTITPRAQVLLVHGMLEHSRRYDYVASSFVNSGFIVLGYDQRGHGKTAEIAAKDRKDGKNTRGILAEKEGFSKVVSDLNTVFKAAKQAFPSLKVILLGHSFGSFVTLSFIERFTPLLDACIVCGTSGPMGALARAGYLYSLLMKRLLGGETCSKLMQNFIFCRYLKRIKEVKTGFEWLSSNQTNIDAYFNDKYCGGVASTSFFVDMLGGVIQVNKTKNISKIDKRLPLYLIAGEEDPVGNYGRGVKSLYERCKKCGIISIDIKLYKGDKHEIFNELDRDLVIEDTIKWIESKL